MRELDPIDYAHVDGAITLEWAKPTSRVGYIRVHKDEEKMPGPTLYTLAVEAYADKLYEFKLCSASKGGRGPNRDELERFDGYMKSLGYDGVWRRAKSDGGFKIVRLK